MDDGWDDDGPTTYSPPAPVTSYQPFTSGRAGKGRGFEPIVDDEEQDNSWGRGGSGRDGRGGGRYGERHGRGGSRGSGDGRGRYDDEGGRSGGRGGRGGNRGRFNDHGDSYGSNRYGRNNDSDKEEDSFHGGRGRGRGRGAQNGDSGGRKEEDWICPESECGHKNFGFRFKCQKCDTEKPGGKRGGEKPRPEIYIPAEPTDDDEELFGSSISTGINFDKYDSIKVKVTGNDIPSPIKDFSSAGLRPFVLDNIRKSGYNKPTPVQKFAISGVMNGRDLMACAQTGSGKTAAFLIPIINTLLEDQRDLVFGGETCEPQAIIVSPTRELTIQIFDEARKFSRGSILKISIVYGGTGTMHQASKLMSGCHILVATPGRLNDFVNRGRVSFGSVRFFVLDEADRMLDMGFIDDMKKMLNHSTMIPTGDRQTLMFSATFPDEIQELAGQFLHNYIFLAVGIVGGACSDVEQIFYQVERKDKKNKLYDLLQQDKDKVLVFVETKRNADFIAIFLSEKHIPTTSIHGDRLQRERETALVDFKLNRMRVLVATAVAARGLDIKGVAHVINYDLPKSIDEYVHRIGRTGRVGNRGKATSFYDSDTDGPLAPFLVKILQQAEQEVPEWLDSETCGGSSSFQLGRNFGATDYRKTDSFNNGPQPQPQAAEYDEEW